MTLDIDSRVAPPTQLREEALAVTTVLQRLDRLAQSTTAEANTIRHRFEQSAGRLSILGSMLSAEAAAEQLGSRAIQTAELLTREVAAISAIRRDFLTTQLRLANDLATLQRPGGLLDLAHPYSHELDGLSRALHPLQERVERISSVVTDPLRRATATLDHLGVRIVLGATDVGEGAAGRVAQYGHRLKELARRFAELIGAIDTYQQGMLAALAAQQHDLAEARHEVSQKAWGPEGERGH